MQKVKTIGTKTIHEEFPWCTHTPENPSSDTSVFVQLTDTLPRDRLLGLSPCPPSVPSLRRHPLHPTHFPTRRRRKHRSTSYPFRSCVSDCVEHPAPRPPPPPDPSRAGPFSSLDGCSSRCSFHELFRVRHSRGPTYVSLRPFRPYTTWVERPPTLHVPRSSRTSGAFPRRADTGVVLRCGPGDSHSNVFSVFLRTVTKPSHSSEPSRYSPGSRPGLSWK